MATKTAKKTTAKKVTTKKVTTRRTASRKDRGAIEAEYAGQAAIAKFLKKTTKAALQEEAKALPSKFSKVTFPPADLVADAKEMLFGVEDVKDLKKRKFPVNEHTFTRLQLLLEPVTPLAVVRAENVTAAKQRTQDADASRARLLEIRSELARLADTVKLPAEWFQLGTRRSDRINPVVQRMTEVLALARKHRSKLPDPVKVNALLKEGEELIETHTIVRVERSEIQGMSSTQVKLADRYAKLLWDVMQHLSAVGLAAYPGDLTREKRYRLDNVYADRPTKKVVEATEA